MAEARYSIGEDIIIAFDTEGRNIHRAIVSGMKDKSINKYPFTKKFERDKRRKPNSKEIKHNLNFKVEFSFLIR